MHGGFMAFFDLINNWLILNSLSGCFLCNHCGNGHDDERHERLMEARLAVAEEDEHECAHDDDGKGEQWDDGESLGAFAARGGFFVEKRKERDDVKEEEQIVVKEICRREPLHGGESGETGGKHRHAHLAVHIFAGGLVGHESAHVYIVGYVGVEHLTRHLREVFNDVAPCYPSAEVLLPVAVSLHSVDGTAVGYCHGVAAVEQTRVGSLLAVVVPRVLHERHPSRLCLGEEAAAIEACGCADDEKHGYVSTCRA